MKSSSDVDPAMCFRRREAGSLTLCCRAINIDVDCRLMHPVNMTLAGQCGKRTTIVRCHSCGGDVWPSAKPSSPTKHVKTRRPSCHAYVPLQLCSITCISHPRSSQHYAFSSLYGCIWALGFEGRKAGIVVLCSTPLTLIVMHHYTILTAVRCPLRAVLECHF